MVMESPSLSITLCASPPFGNHPKTSNLNISNIKSFVSHKPHFPTIKAIRLLRQTNALNETQRLSAGNPPLLSKTCLSLALCNLLNGLPCFASEAVASSANDVSDKINLEAILVSIDDFFNRNPFFVAGCTFIWLVVIPVAEYYLMKYKYISAIDAFRKLRDDPNVQLLDIRDGKSVAALRSPSLKYMNKGVVRVEYAEANEDRFVKEVLESFKDPENTSICILDNSDGNSLKVAELLYKNGFKEGFAIKGGVRGKKGWLAIQEELLPPSVHMKPTKKSKTSKVGTNGTVNQLDDNEKLVSSSPSPPNENLEVVNDGVLSQSAVPTLSKKSVNHSSSPYPNYPDLKPPSSPTPSKPKV